MNRIKAIHKVIGYCHGKKDKRDKNYKFTNHSLCVSLRKTLRPLRLIFLNKRINRKGRKENTRKDH
jgi:hypothetical protein